VGGRAKHGHDTSASGGEPAGTFSGHRETALRMRTPDSQQRHTAPIRSRALVDKFLRAVSAHLGSQTPL
jgi:hypothetical protein